VTDLELIGPVAIRVPPEPLLARVLRLAASGVASLSGFTVDEIENIKVAVSEVLIALIEHGEGNPVDMTFAVEKSLFEVCGRTAVDSFDSSHPDLVLCRTVLADVCAEHQIDLIDGEVRIRAAVSHEAIA
jgi:hypothetical protein